MTRYWASWWTGNYADEGCTKPPFQVRVTGSRERANDEERDDQSICAVLDVARESDVERTVCRYFPDAQFRFYEARPSDWQPPADRFPRRGA